MSGNVDCVCVTLFKSVIFGAMGSFHNPLTSSSSCVLFHLTFIYHVCVTGVEKVLNVQCKVKNILYNTCTIYFKSM